MNDRKWADKHVTLLGVFHIVCHSLGFALGVYTLWALMRDEVVDHLRSGGGESPGPLA